MAASIVKILNPDTKTVAFELKSGELLTLCYSNGKNHTDKVTYIDNNHFLFGFKGWDIRQFADFCKKQGIKVKKGA